MKYIKKLINILYPKYEVTVLMVHITYKDERLREYQNAGWVIAGDIRTEGKQSIDITFYIPMKRIIK